jgi:hypothetical protein
MTPDERPRTSLLTLTLLALLALLPPASDAEAQARELAPGTYRCSAYNVSGGGGSCRTMPSLVLNPDGTYQYSSTRGRWTIREDRLLLSESALWGAGEILGRDTIRFEYDYRGWRHVVTWICQACSGGADTGSGPERGSTPKGPHAGMSLTLEFGTAVGGVSTFTIVPAESARSYSHNAPLPPGSMQGLAWEKSRTAVALATNRNNKLLHRQALRGVPLVAPRDHPGRHPRPAPEQQRLHDDAPGDAGWRHGSCAARRTIRITGDTHLSALTR